MNPFKQLGVRASMMLFSGVAIVALVVMAIASWVNMSNSDAVEQELVEAVERTKIAGDLDMMHDALNSDVMSARLEGNNAPDAKKKELQDDLAKHIDILEKSLAELEKMSPSGPLHDALAKAKPDAVAYVAGAREIVAEALKAGANEAKVKEFDDRFGRLEKTLGAVSELSESTAKDATAHSVTQGARAKWVLAITVLVSLGVLLTSAVLFANTTLRRLGAEPVELRALAQRIADNDLTHHLRGSPHPASVAGGMHRMQENLSSIITRLLGVAQTVANSSGEIAAGNNDLAQRTENQATSLEKTASAMEQMNATVRQNADNARQANTLAMSASTVAVQGGEVVAQVVDTMKGINDASRKISDIISVIDGIAFQTNILALNAAVEAARAGEQGRGFAVVATEVRTLAGRSADAAKEIKALINASVERVEHGTALVDRAGVTMQEVVTSIRRVTDIVGEISVASAEQATGVAEIGNAVTQLDDATQQNAALVEEMARAALALNEEAQRMVHIVGRFQVGSGGQSNTPASAGMGAGRAAAPALSQATLRQATHSQPMKRLAG